MYGPVGYPPPPPRHAGAAFGRVVLRAVLCAAALLSLGMLAWVPLLALAITTRRARDWAVCAVGGPLVLAALVLTGWTEKDDDWQTVGGFCLLIAFAVAASAYYLTVDVRHVARRRRAVSVQLPGNPYLAATPVYPYGTGPALPVQMPMPAAGFGPAVPPAPAMPPVPESAFPAPAPAAPGTAPAGRPGGGERMDEVRAGLDELSAYLREAEGPAS